MCQHFALAVPTVITDAAACPVHSECFYGFCMLTLVFVANICWPSLSLLLQTKLTEFQQSCSTKEDQLQHLALELRSAQASASALAKVHEEKEQQLQQQKTTLKQVQAQSSIWP